MPTVREANPTALKIFIMGRMSPPHLGHKHLIDFARKEAKRVPDAEVYLFLGDAKEPSKRNPLSFDLRKRIIEDVYGTKVKVIKDPLCDDDKVWFKKFANRLRRLGINLHTGMLIGHMKPDNGYLNDFHKYQRYLLENIDNLSSTDLRQKISEGSEWRHLSITQNEILLEEIEKQVRKF